MLSTKPFEVPRDLLARAKGMPAINMAIAGAGSIEVMQCVKSGIETGVLRPVLVGNREKMESLAAQCGLSLSGLHIVETESEEAIAKASVAAVRAGDAKAIMKGDIHTNTLLRAVLDKTLGLRTGSRLSHVFHMTIPDSDRVLYIADGAVNVAPDLATLGVIINNARAWRCFRPVKCPMNPCPPPFSRAMPQWPRKPIGVRRRALKGRWRSTLPFHPKPRLPST